MKGKDKVGMNYGRSGIHNECVGTWVQKVKIYETAQVIFKIKTVNES